MTQTASRSVAIVTGASTGIGRELARLAAKDGCDLIIAADDPRIQEAAQELRGLGAEVIPLELDLTTTEAVDQLYAAAAGRPVDTLFANAGHGLGADFVDQNWDEIRHVIDTNVTGTVYLIHKVAADMRARRQGRILITGSIAGFIPGTYQAVYNGTKAFIDSFATAIRHEMKDTGVSVTVLMPGATETEFFERADMLDTKVGSSKKDDAADVARVGFEAMKKGEGSVVYGFKNKMQVAASKVLSRETMAELHAKQAEPGTNNR
jgi:short-subunit dehydrogenase